MEHFGEVVNYGLLRAGQGACKGQQTEAGVFEPSDCGSRPLDEVGTL